MWAEDIDDITVEYEEDGVMVVKQEQKEIIARGTWPVLAFVYREWNPTANDYGPPKFTLRKFRKQSGTYRMESKLNIGNTVQARAISEVLKRWTDELGVTEEVEVPKVSAPRKKKS
jgi:hypothetical protein